MDVSRVLLFLVSVGLVYNEESTIEDERVKALMKERGRYQRVRCTRRFTPGSCLDPVRPVWTFVAPLQTCTERLGCPAGVFSNRYNSYAECASMCSELVYLYMFLQSLEKETFRVPDEESSTRQANVDAVYSEFMLGKDASDEDADKYDINKEEDFRRSFHEELSNLPESNLDYAVERPYQATDNRPPPPSRRELSGEGDHIVPYVNRF